MMYYHENVSFFVNFKELYLSHVHIKSIKYNFEAELLDVFSNFGDNAAFLRWIKDKTIVWNDCGIARIFVFQVPSYAMCRK